MIDDCGQFIPQCGMFQNCKGECLKNGESFKIIKYYQNKHAFLLLFISVRLGYAIYLSGGIKCIVYYGILRIASNCY